MLRTQASFQLATLVAGAAPGGAAFWGARAAAHAYLCSCQGSRAAASLASLCLGLLVTFAVAEALRRRFGRDHVAQSV